MDRAHSRGIWLDIGVPSVRNLRGIAWKKIILWWLFAFSGIPLYLFYNSVVFSTINPNEYQFFIGTPDLVTGVGLNFSAPSIRPLQYFQNAASWDNLTNEE